MIAIAEILEFLGSQPDPLGSGDTGNMLEGPGTIDSAGTRQLAFCGASAPGAVNRARGTRAGLLLADRTVVEQMTGERLIDTVVISTERARLDFARVVDRFFAGSPPPPGIHLSAVVAPDARIAPSASVGPLCTVGDHVEIGAGCVLHAGVHVYPRVRIGNHVIIHSGTVIGAEGFGYERDEEGRLVRIPHVGGVVIEDHVEIGANTAIDRGAIDDTVIGEGARIDNLVHIAHNVRVGADAAVIAHAMVAGSVKLGDRAWIAPASTLRDGIAVGDDAVVGLGAVVTRDVPAGETVLGSPARGLDEHRRLQDVLRDLLRRKS